MDLIQEDFPRTPSPVFPLNIAGLAPDVGAHPDVAERHAADGLLPSEETARRPIPQQVNSNLETLSASIQALSVQPDTLVRGWRVSLLIRVCCSPSSMR